MGINVIICQVDDHYNKLLEVEMLILALCSVFVYDLKGSVVVVLKCPDVHPYPRAEEYSETWLEIMKTVFSHSRPACLVAVLF